MRGGGSAPIPTCVPVLPVPRLLPTLDDYANSCNCSVAQRAKSQRLLNAALGLVALEDLASMVLPVQPVREYSDWVDGAGATAEQEWRRFLRDDVRPPSSAVFARCARPCCLLQTAGTAS